MIRRAVPSDRTQVVATARAAFADDPAWKFILNDEYHRLAPQFIGADFDVRMLAGNVWVSDDLATVAMWDGPSDRDRHPRQADEIWARYRAVAGERACERLLSYQSAISATAPSGAYWYLGVLATHPARQREGLGTAVLAPVFEIAARAGIGCCLETSTEANRRFYERRGFIEPREVPLSGGPLTWWLRRPAATQQNATACPTDSED